MGVATFGGSLLSGFTSSHKKLTLISGLATFGGSLLSELYGMSVTAVVKCPRCFWHDNIPFVPFAVTL